MDSELQRAGESFREALAGRTAAWCQQHPREDERQWSAQQVVEHLVLAMESSQRVLELRLEKRRITKSRSTPVQRLVRFMVLRLGRIPRGAPAAPFVRPGLLHWSAMDGGGLAETLLEAMESLDGIVARAEQSFGRHAAASHFLLGPMKAGEWRRFHILHCRHHLEQIRRIEAAVGAEQPEAGERAPVP